MTVGFWRFLFQFSWAKSLSWFDENKTGKRIHHIISVCIIECRAQKTSMNAVRIIVGPIAITSGFATCNKVEL